MTPRYALSILAVPLATMALGAAPQVDTPDQTPPTVLEQALVERACAAMPATTASNPDARALCISAQLTLLRGDFGIALGRLSASERTRVDAACSRMQTMRGREGYLDCINEQLIAMRNRRTRAGRAVTIEPVAAPAPKVAAIDPVPAAPAGVGAQHTWLLAGAALTIVAAAGAAGVVAVRGCRTRRVCRTCGASMSESGDLCVSCRHEAAEALRRAATERLEQVRADEAERRRAADAADDLRRKQAQQDEAARLREQDDARQRDQAQRQAEETARLKAAAIDAAPDQAVEEAFDPYAVLGVPRETNPEAVRAAYEQARSKYDHDRVAHLGVDVQEHFRAKAEAVDRAYQMLAR